MKFRDRLIIFIFGAILGVILVTFIKSQRARENPPSAQPTTAVDIQRTAAPGIYQAYQERGVPMQSDFIQASKLYAHPDDDKYYRVLILQGQEPEQTLRIEETVVKTKQGEVIGKVRVMSADRMLVTLAKGNESSTLAQKIKPWGYRVVERGEGPDDYLLNLGAKEPETVADALDRLRELEIVVKADPLIYKR